MAWYDVFSRFYDASIEPHYREQRILAADALNLEPGSTVLDLPCGTGQSFPALIERVGQTGRVIGADLSAGMRREADRRIVKAGWDNASVIAGNAQTLTRDELPAAPDRLHIFLGMSVFADHTQALNNLWGLLVPGGRCVIVDVHSPKLGFQGRMVNWTAGADIRREFWAPLEAVGENFERTELPSKPLHGGKIYMATADKPQG